MLYVPYLLYGGFIVDDQAIAGVSANNAGFVMTYKTLFPQFANRPFAPLLFSITSNVFGDTIRPYLAINAIVWLSAIALIAWVIRRAVHLPAAMLFFIFGSLPIFSSTILFSPAVMIMGSFSVLFWAVSLYAVLIYTQKRRPFLLITSSFFALLSLLSYEATLPLLVFNLLLPLIIGELETRERFNVLYIKRYVVPVASALILAVLYQKVLAPQLSPDISRLRFRGLAIIPAATSKFIFLLVADIPLLLGRAFVRIREIPLGAWVSILALGSAIGSLWHNSRILNEYAKKRTIRATAIAGFAAAATLGLYILAGTLPRISGYDNRGLIGFGIALAVLLACIFPYLWRRHWLAGALCIVVSMVYSMSFVLQRQNYIHSARLQREIRIDLAARAAAAHVPVDDFILVTLPGYLSTNFNNEVVFGDELDTRISIPTSAGDIVGVPLSRRRIISSRTVLENDIIRSDDFSGSVAAAWYYRANEQGIGVLKKITDTEELLEIIRSLQADDQTHLLAPDPWFAVMQSYREYVNIPPIDASLRQYEYRWRSY